MELSYLISDRGNLKQVTLLTITIAIRRTLLAAYLDSLSEL